MTPLSALIRTARLAATPTPAELDARAARGTPPTDGITQQELADRARISREVVNRAERSLAKSSRGGGVSEATLAAIVDALGLDVALVATSNEKKRERGTRLPPLLAKRAHVALLRLHEERHGGNASSTARDLGVTPSAISQLLSGRNSPSMGLLTRIAEKLEVSADNLLGIRAESDETAR